MELTAKVRGGKYVVSDEAGRKVAEVQKLLLKNGQMRVAGENGELLYLIAKNRDHIEVTCGEMDKPGCSMAGRILYEQDGAGNVIQTSLFRPPMAESLILETSWGELKLVQDQKREFEIFLREKKVGELSHMMSAQKKIKVLSGELPEAVYGLILGLGMYMLREDDVEII